MIVLLMLAAMVLYVCLRGCRACGHRRWKHKAEGCIGRGEPIVNPDYSETQTPCDCKRFE